MRTGLLRALLTLAVFVTAWLVASPAQARLAANAASAANASFVPATLIAPTPSAPPPETVPPGSRAPLCDARGAITFASAPQMQDVEVTLDTGLTPEDCLGGSPSDRSGRAAPGRAPLPIDASSASTDAAVLAAAVALVACGRELLPAPVASTPRSRPGIRSTVDRPPRV